MPDLALAFLLVSCISLVSQAAALARLSRSGRRTPEEGLAARGYVRTAACRVLAAAAYTAVASVQLAGDGSLSGEALIVFSAVQGLWITNSLLDIRIRRNLSQGKWRHAR